MLLIRTDVASLDICIERIIYPLTRTLQLLCHLNGAQILGGMIYLTTYQIEGVVEPKQGRITPVGIETTVGKRQTLIAYSFDERIFTVVVEVALVELHSHTAPEFHDAISTVVYGRTDHREVGGLDQVEAIGTTTVEVTVLHQVLSSASHTNDTTRAIAAFSMADRQVLHLTMVTVDEIEAIGITGIDLDTGVAFALDNQTREVQQRQLTTIRLRFTDHHRLFGDDGRSVGCPATTGLLQEQLLILQHTRQVQMNILSNNHGTIVTKSIEELGLSADKIDVLTQDRPNLVGTTSVISQTSDILTGVGSIAAEGVGHSLLTLDQLDVQLFDDMELDGLVIIAGLIPRLFAEVFLQVLRLELPSVTGKDLVSHDAQLILRETSEIGRIQQTVRELVADRLLFEIALKVETMFQIIGRERHLPHSISVGVAYSKEVHAILTNILHAPAYLRTK